MEFTTIEKPYLIQRGTFKKIKDSEIVGVDSLISFDYMGSSEFEFGALPQSCRRITSSWNEYEVFPMDVKDNDNQEMFLLCRKKQAEEIKTVLKIFIACEYPMNYRTKERVCLYNYLNPRSTFDLNINLWWDITESNDWILCFGDNIRRLIIAINKTLLKHAEKDSKNPNNTSVIAITGLTGDTVPTIEIISALSGAEGGTGGITIGPKIPGARPVPISDAYFDIDRKVIKVMVPSSNATSIIVKRNILGLEVTPDELIVSVNTKSGSTKQLRLKMPQSSVRSALISEIKSQLSFNSH